MKDYYHSILEVRDLRVQDVRRDIWEIRKPDHVPRGTSLKLHICEAHRQNLVSHRIIFLKAEHTRLLVQELACGKRLIGCL